MANEKLYGSKMLIGALYRSELAGELAKLGYGIEKTHADGRFEIAGVPRRVIEAYSTRRAQIEAAMAERGLGTPAENQRLAQRAALMTRASRREVDKQALRESWERQAADLGFDARALAAAAQLVAGKDAGWEGVRETLGPTGDGRGAEPAMETAAGRAVAWAVAHLSEREAVFSRTDLLAAALAWEPGSATIGEVEGAVARLEKAGTLHTASLPGAEDSLTTDKAVADEKETISLMRTGQGHGAAPMRGRAVDKALRNGPLTAGQKGAVRLILSDRDRVVGVQGYAGTGKTTMLNRARALLEKRGYAVSGLAPSASAARTLQTEAGIESETLQRFLARNAGVAEGRLTRKGERDMRAAYGKTVLVVDEGSLASTAQARDLLRIANALRVPRVVLVGDEKQLDAVDAGKPFAQLQAAGMKTAVMDEIMRQRDPELKAAVEASLAGDVRKAFEKLGSNVAEVNPDNLAGAAAARWLALSPTERENAGLMAPSHALREDINAIVRERLIRDGVVHGPAMTTERLVSARLYQCREDARGQLRARRCRGLPPPLQAPRRRKGRRVAGRRHRSRNAGARVNLAGKDGRDRRLGTGQTRGADRRGRGLSRGGHGTARGRPHPLDPQRRRAGAREQPDGGGGRGEGRPRDVQAGGRPDARHAQRRSATTPYRPGMGIDGARFSGADRRYRDRRHGGEPSQLDNAEDPVCRDQPGAGPGRTRHRRQGGAERAARSRDRRANLGAGGDGAGAS